MEYLYVKIASDIEHQISHGVYKVGDKLPSVRSLHQDLNISISTALQVMYHLESKGLIEAMPQKGYFVKKNRLAEKRETIISEPETKEESPDVEALIQKIYGKLQISDAFVNFSVGVPSLDMLPVAKIKKAAGEMLNCPNNEFIKYQQIRGSEKLRRLIANRTTFWKYSLDEEQLITTNGCMDAIALSLMATCTKGDTILVESPVYFGTLQLAQSLGLQVIEVPTSSRDGIDLDAVKKHLEQGKIGAIIVVSNFSNPMGYCMPAEHKKRLVELVVEYDVPLLEEDLYGDVYFGKERPLSCKSIDPSGNVIWCNSFSKTLAPGLRTGWMAPGKYYDKILRLKLYHQVSSPALTHGIVENILEKGRYEHHLKQLRNTLQLNLFKYLDVIHEHFPENTKTTMPQGGFLLWIELDEKYNTVELYDRILQQGIKYAPGRIFTLRNQFYNCLRLTYGLNWNEQTEKALRDLGNQFKNSK